MADENIAKPKKEKPTRLLFIVRVLFILAAVLWLINAAVALVRIGPITSEMGITPLIVPSLMIANAAAMLISCIGINKQRYFFFYFAIGMLLLNILLTALEKILLFDLIIILLDMLLLALLPMLHPWSDNPSFLSER
jgi:hypothetical protein